MSNASDFVLEKGVLKRCVEPVEEVIIPAAVTAVECVHYWAAAA